ETDSQLLGITKYQLFCVLAASISSVNTGWNIAVPNIPNDIISKCAVALKHNINGLPSCVPVSSYIWGLAVGSHALGALIGANACMWFADKYGRRFVLLYSNVIGIVSAILVGLAVNIDMLISGRVIAGIAQGAANGTFSCYVTEVTTPRARNSLAAMTQMAVIVGQMLGIVCSLGMLRPPLWRVLFSLTGAFCIASFLILPLCTESPKWLITKGKLDKAQKGLRRLRKGTDITREFEKMVAETQNSGDGNECTASLLDIVTNRTPENLRHQLLVASMSMVFQQASGISMLGFFSTTLFNTISSTGETKNFRPKLAQILSAVLFVVGMVSTFAGMLLATHVGRRTLMLAAHGAMCIFSVFLSLGSLLHLPALAITMSYLFFAVFFVGPGPIPWAIPSEITPTYAVGSMTAINNSVVYISAFISGLVFEPMLTAMGGYTFLLFAATNALAAVFFCLFLPETKSKHVADVVK
ncbi:general substrate transporter, partial [Coemansia spiralis]